MVLNLNEKTYFLITGASRGIGQTMALRVSEKLGEGSVIVLLARNVDGLNATKSKIESLGKKIQVQTVSIDLSKATAEQFRDLLNRSLQSSGESASNFQRAFIIHNAASIGDVSKWARELSDTKIWMQYYELNLFSAITLNCEFFSAFKGVQKLVVNISSKCAIEPFVSAAYYCTGKAARDMYFGVIAAEEKEDTIVLNYAPGAIDTDMSLYLQENTINTELSETFKNMRDTKTMLTTEMTTEKFLKVLEEQKFKSGDHVDYWD